MKKKVAEKIHLKENIQTLYEKVEKELSQRERIILKMRYGLYNGEEYTQREIARQLGISRSYVSRIEKGAVEKLRKSFYDFKNENVKMIYSLLYARPEVRNINIGYSEELLEDAEKAKKWYINLVKKIHPDANKACPEEAQKAMTELEIIYERIQKCFANEEEE